MSCRTLARRSVCAVAFLAASVSVAFSQTSTPPTVPNPPTFDFVTIGAVNNPAYNGTPGNPLDAANAGVLGRGSVSYEYALSRTELTHAQYVPFINVLATRPGNSVSTFMRNTWGLIDGPSVMGMRTDLNYSGPGRKFEVAPGAENWPVLGMSWRLAAMYCNWMHNGMQDDPQSMTSGAYDISTFNNSFQWTDQITKSPGARFWIPTLDEWIKAAHYDPHRHGHNQGGYWLYPTSSDIAPLPGLPRDGGQFFNQISEANNVGMYPAFASPWGLLDMAGCGSEWTESVLDQTGFNYSFRDERGGDRLFGGGARLDGRSGLEPFSNGSYLTALRVATVPSPGGGFLLFVGIVASGRQRR